MLSLAAQPHSPQRVSSENIPVVTVTVNVPTGDWLEDYMGWIRIHPEAKKQASSNILTLDMPYLEFFSPDGLSLYRGGNDEQNAAFLEGLQHEIPSHSLVTGNTLRPSLDEYVKMINQLKPYESALLDGKKFTIFAVTYRDKAMCKLQNAALRQFGSRPNIRVIEIDLHSS
jgi:hypothetical protein